MISKSLLYSATSFCANGNVAKAISTFKGIRSRSEASIRCTVVVLKGGSNT